MSANNSPVVWVLQGPNLNLLGQREPHIYGTQTLAMLHLELQNQAQAMGLSLKCLQSNHEGQLIDWVHEARDLATGGLIINPGGYTHTSVALRDALSSYQQPIIEVHISNIAARETFRHTSMVSPVVTGTITGLGFAGYSMALQVLGMHSQQSLPQNNLS
jgi:3-dehydroquinate dehydratase II